MLDTGSDLEPFPSKPSTLTVSTARALCTLTRSDGDRRRHAGGWCEQILGGAASVGGGFENALVLLTSDGR